MPPGTLVPVDPITRPFPMPRPIPDKITYTNNIVLGTNLARNRIAIVRKGTITYKQYWNWLQPSPFDGDLEDDERLHKKKPHVGIAPEQPNLKDLVLRGEPKSLTGALVNGTTFTVKRLATIYHALGGAEN